MHRYGNGSASEVNSTLKQLVVAIFEANDIDIDSIASTYQATKDISHQPNRNSSHENAIYLSILEQGLGICQYSNQQITTTGGNHSMMSSTHEGHGGLFSCRSPNDWSKDTNLSDQPQFWTPPIDPSIVISDAIGSSKPSRHINTVPLLDERVPFSSTFYVTMGKLLSMVYNNPIELYSSPTTSSSIMLGSEYYSNDGEVGEYARGFLSSFSLYQHIDSVRITRIFMALINMDVCGNGQISTSSGKRQKNDDIIVEKNRNGMDHFPVDLGISKGVRFSFLELLLHFTEGNDLEIQAKRSFKKRLDLSTHQSSSTHEQYSSSTRHKVIPVISSIFRHMSLLPQLESIVHKMIRDFRNAASANTSSLSNGSIDIQKRAQNMKEYQERLEGELKEHVSSLEYILGLMYEKSHVRLRKKMRVRLGSVFHAFSVSSGSGIVRGISLMGIENTSAAGMDSLLRILLRVLRGISVPQKSISTIKTEEDIETFDGTFTLNETYRHLLFQVLLPLHKPSGMVLWRDQAPLLGLYHKPLVQCICAIVSLDHLLIGKVIDGLLHPDIWPIEQNSSQNTRSESGVISNTPKVLLLLHEIDTLIGLLGCKDSADVTDNEKYDMKDCIIPLVLRLSSCIASDNSRTSERALQFFKNSTFQLLIKLHLQSVMTPLMRALCRVDSGMDVPWNPTVRKMTLIVIHELQSYDSAVFEDCCRCLYCNNVDERKVDTMNHSKGSKKELGATQRSIILNNAPNSLSVASLKKFAGWKPPSSSVRPPNLTPMGTVVSTPVASFSVSISQPPLGVTGIAPWAVNNNSPIQSTVKKNLIPKLKPMISHDSGRKDKLALFEQKQTSKHTRNNSSIEIEDTQNQLDVKEKTACGMINDESSFRRVQDYIEKLKPPFTDASNATTSWVEAQMSESPVLLPNLKFHDLVFGETLGTGAFSTVKYARRIVKNKSRSFWPEYAVKIVGTQKIEELGYEQSINREIAILRILSHPSIARLVSSFRFKNGAYLVLEYASGGDLHTILNRNGSLNERSTKFVIGEVVAALSSIHDLGFIYGDLKPENILIMENGHIKLTDFGGCRPSTTIAKEMIKQELAKNTLQNLRNGDWRDITPDKPNPKSFEKYEDTDDRIEGTTTYLPPEVILGAIPTQASDAWALGCCLFQCLSGRPPILEDDEVSTRHKIVTFELPSSNTSDFKDGQFFLEDSGIQAFSDAAKNLTKELLAKNPPDRPNMAMVSSHVFFEGIDIFCLYKSESLCLDVGAVAPVLDAKWSRRQFSSIWAPQPESYSTSVRSSTISKDRLECRDIPIVEGDERGGAFLKVSRSLTQVVEMQRDDVR